jgi:AsmA-like protein
MRALQYVPRSKAGRIVVLAIAAALVAGIVALHHYWPFTESAVRAELSSSASADVHFGKFRRHYFPPGCVAENVVFTRKQSNTPLLTIEKLEITSNLGGLIRHHVSTIRAEQALVNWREWRNPGNDPSSTRTVVDHLIATNTVVEVAQSQPKQPLRFIFHRLKIDNLRGPGNSNFEADVDNPLPHGNLHLSGHFGNSGRAPKQAPVGGTYKLEKADLSVFKSVGGLLSSTGKFQGTLNRLIVDGETTTPEFEVAKTHHAQPLTTRFSAIVDAIHGDVTLPHVTAQFGRDDLDVRGAIARGNDGKRAAVLEINCLRGRIEDTFYPFMHKPQSAILGDVTFTMDVRIPGGNEPFLKKLSLQSDFRIQNAHFVKPETQVQLSKVAEAPDQRQPNTAMPVQIQGAVKVQHGIAHFARLSLQDHHASASFRGNYELTDEHVDLHGRLKTEASLTKATKGIGSFFAKILEPFFKKKPHENVVPVKISGTYNNPKFGLDL